MNVMSNEHKSATQSSTPHGLHHNAYVVADQERTQHDER